MRNELLVARGLQGIGQPVIKTQAEYLELLDENFYEALAKRGAFIEKKGKISVMWGIPSAI